MGEFGYILFPDVESDVLKSFGSDNKYMNFARVGMALVYSAPLAVINVCNSWNKIAELKFQCLKAQVAHTQQIKFAFTLIFKVFLGCSEVYILIDEYKILSIDCWSFYLILSSPFQVAIACYPLQCYPARSIVEDAIKHLLHHPASQHLHVFVTLLLFTSTLVTALLITDLGTVSLVIYCFFFLAFLFQYRLYGYNFCTW